MFLWPIYQALRSGKLPIPDTYYLNKPTASLGHYLGAIASEYIQRCLKRQLSGAIYTRCAHLKFEMIT